MAKFGCDPLLNRHISVYCILMAFQHTLKDLFRDHTQISPFNTNVRSVRSLMTPSPPSQSVRLNGDLMKASSAAITLNLQPMSVKGSHLCHFLVDHYHICTKSCQHINEHVYRISRQYLNNWQCSRWSKMTLFYRFSLRKNAKFSPIKKRTDLLTPSPHNVRSVRSY